MQRALITLVVCLLASVHASADDWPEFRGERRAGVWNESGILEKFPTDGLKILWRAPINSGYSSPTVSDGRVFITDFNATNGYSGTERALALDEKTGRLLWTVEWEANYGGIMWANGPRATPVVDGDRVYVLGVQGNLQCINVKTGRVLWARDYQTDYNAPFSGTGFSSAPVVDGSQLIAIVGGSDALVVAFDKLTGKELWRSLKSSSDPGVAQPILIDAGGVRQVIVWDGSNGVYSLDPATGNLYWELPFKVPASMNIPVPVFADSKLLLTNFYNGSMMATLDTKKPTATMLWRSKSDSEIDTDTLHSVLGTPIVMGDYVYGFCSYGQLRALKVSTGERVWETQAVTKERARWASAYIVRNGNRVFITNDRGELIIARLTPEGYEEIDRTKVIDPTSPAGVRRQLGAVIVAHPAYANRNIYMRNDEELVAASLAIEDGGGSSLAPGTLSASASESFLPNQNKVLEIQYIPALSGARKLADKFADYSTLYLLLGEGGNATAFVSDSALVLINTMAPGWGEAIIEKLKLVTEKPVSTIINTQPGINYTGSNGAFSTATIVAHANAKTAMEKMPDFDETNAHALPSKVFKDRLSLFEGDDRVDLHYFGPAHTNGDVVVTIPAHYAAYLGELFPHKGVPRIDRTSGGSALKFPETLDRAIAALRAIDIEFAIPGRAEPKRGGPQIDVMTMREVEEYADFVRDFVKTVKAAFETGKTSSQAATSLAILSDRYENYDMEDAPAMIAEIYRELSQ